MDRERAVIYARLSIARDTTSSLLRQERACRSWAHERDVVVVETHVDNGRSAFGPAVARDGLASALAALRGGRAETLVVWKLDRLSRRGMVEVAEVLALVAASGGRLVAVADEVDTGEPAAQALVAALAHVAHAESVNLGQRVRAAKKDLRDRGLWLGGQAPYGYRARDGRLWLQPAEAAVLRRAAEALTSGASLTKVCRQLNTAGTPAPRGGQWGVSTLLQLLRGPATAGLLPQTLRGPGGQFSSTVVPWLDPASGQPVSALAPGEEPVLDPQAQVDLVALLSARRSADPRAWSPRGHALYLLTGLLRCAHCGGRMSASGNSYRCQAVRTGHLCDEPGGAYIPALDSAVVERVKVRLETDGSPFLVESGGLACSQPDPSGWFAEAADAERRQVIAALVHHVTVSRGRRGCRFDPDVRMQVTWRAT